MPASLLQILTEPYAKNDKAKRQINVDMKRRLPTIASGLRAFRADAPCKPPSIHQDL